MTELATVESTALTTSRDRLIVESGPKGASLNPDVLTWIHEAQRLFDEAERRLQTGAVLPALSSLAAVPLSTSCFWVGARRCLIERVPMMRPPFRTVPTCEHESPGSSPYGRECSTSGAGRRQAHRRGHRHSTRFAVLARALAATIHGCVIPPR